MSPGCHNQGWRAGARRWALAGCVALAAMRGEARDGADFFFQTWQTEDGLPQNHITAIVQTRSGYLWLGTFNGLARFDGSRFVVFNATTTPGLNSSRITSLYEDAHGALWLGHDAGEVTRFLDGRFEPVSLGTNWPGGIIAAIGEDGQNDLWLLRENGLVFRLRDGDMVLPEPGLNAPAVPSFARDERGTLWRVHGGKMRIVGAPAAGQTPPAPPGNDFIVRACAGRDEGLWLAGGRRLRRWAERGRDRDWGVVPWGDEFVTAMRESHDGRLWVGTLSKGLFVLSPAGRFTQFTRTNGLAHDWVRSLGEDREGTVWVGTGGGGLSAVREQRVTMVQPPDRWQGRAVLSIYAATNDTIWFGTEGGGVYRWRQDEWTRFGEREGLANAFVWSVIEDNRGRTWAGTWGRGLFQLVDGRFVHPPAPADEAIPVCALHTARDGAIWAGTQRGLLRMADGVVERHAQQLSRPDVRAIAETQDGTIWFGMSGGGLGRWRQGEVSQYRQADGLPSDYVWSLLAEADGTLWIGTFGGGLCRWREGRFVTIGTREGLPNNVICHIADDGYGRLWLGSYGGILRARKNELNECADGRVKSVAFFAYGKADGLVSLECSGGLQPAGCRLADGRLWFPTSSGPAVVDPANVRTNPLAPPVLIEELLVDDVPEALQGSNLGAASATSAVTFDRSISTRLVIPPGQQRFEFRFTALSFVAPERVRFKYRLEGLETEWVNAGVKRIVNYSFLLPGDYTFRVIACNDDGVWNTTGASLALKVEPHFWQTWWFRAAGALASAGVVGGGVRGITRRRYRHKLERLERQRAVERERTRIAKDIHDDLGASLTRITLLSQSARSDLDPPDQTAASLDQIYNTARQLTQAMDEIVWAVNPHHDTLDSLVTYLGGFAQDFLSAAGVRCRLDVPLHLPATPLTAEVRHNLFLAFKEAVHNVVRHAAATEARIAFKLEPPGFTLAVCDDGKGFDCSRPFRQGEPGTAGQPTRPGAGNGLPNMRKRLEEIGGRCVIESAAGTGTLVRFTVSLQIAK